MEEKDNLQLPENAFRELKDGEEYKPLMSPDKVYPEVNGWSVTWGIVMAVIFCCRSLRSRISFCARSASFQKLGSSLK